MTPAPRRPDSQRWHGLGLALLCGLGLLLLSYARRCGDLDSALFHDEVINTLVETPLWHTALLRNVLVFALALLALHLAFGLACWLLARAAERAWPAVPATRRQWVGLWAIGLALALLLHNAAAFPGSSLGGPYAGLARAGVAGISVAGLAGALALLAAGATLLRALRRGPARPRLLLALGCAVLAVAAFARWPQPAAGAARTGPSTAARPNVILVGVDSLRDDLIAADGTSRHAPNVARFLAGATRFSDAITPLARTFPSWVSILTGEQPHTTGATINLLPRERVDARDALGFQLGRAGYRTVYAIDETRFSNVDATYGFNQTITPPIGATDFLLSWFGDTPLSNAIVNTAAGRWLLPNIHANRAAAVTYDPDTFVQRIDRELRPDGRPLLLAAHLTLGHWPYSWQSGTGPTSDDTASLRAAYLLAIERADRQFAALMAVLERKGLLHNAIVVVLSDHGESFEPGGDSIGPGNPEDLRALEAVPGWGHGTSVLAPDQYRVVLGLRLPGQAAAGATLAAPVSLEDLNPTILELLRLPPAARVDGQSLAPLLRGSADAAARFAGRIRFTESEFTPKAFAHAQVQASASGVALASVYYRIDPVSDRLQMREEYVDRLTANRQFAAFTDAALVAALPDPRASGYAYLQLPEPFRQGSMASLLPAAAADPPEHARLRGALQRRFRDVLDRGAAARAAPPQS